MNESSRELADAIFVQRALLQSLVERVRHEQQNLNKLRTQFAEACEREYGIAAANGR